MAVGEEDVAADVRLGDTKGGRRFLLANTVGIGTSGTWLVEAMATESGAKPRAAR
jgi:hypothetical protein